ncbi:hypothetical protein WMY93_015032 [Mugilogobius chulae]|uniref:TERF1-interacting nuclear factor 2 N-terminal domain-containing protein n=1 Tax=Mugilogobius chulae TaxID=88201 RepID=A0AAW0P625_9GOBI
MATKKPKMPGVACTSQASLPFAALKLLAPPVRLVSAALWKVMKERDVMQYGIVEEFITSACDTVPGLLTLRHQARLTLGFRARLILELCKRQPDPKAIAVHMRRIQVSVPSSSSSSAVDEKIQKTLENFHALVPDLLTNKTKRERYYKEDFPALYGPAFDQALEKLLWEFLIRLDQLLPVPNLTQTVSWLSEAPPVLEECARAATQPQLLKVLLQHQSCLGHLETAASLPPDMGDCILTSLSLPPSGKLPTNEPTDQSPSTSHYFNKTPFIKPVFGLLSNENVPCMISASKRSRSSATTGGNNESSSSGPSEVEEVSASQVENVGTARLKRKHIVVDEDSSDDEDVIRCVKRRTTRNSQQSKSAETSFDNREILKACLHSVGLKTHRIPDNDFVCSVWFSCLNRQPKVKVKRLSLLSSADDKNPKPRSASSRVSSTQTQATYGGSPGSDKENTPSCPRSQRSSLRRKRIERHDQPGETEDYVADSEDEATKNFKGRLFAKRYCKTKHGTYVPTLREYWRPCAEKRSVLSPGSKRR